MRRNARTNGFYDGVFPTTSGIVEEDSQFMRRKEEKKKEREMEGFDLVWFGVVGLVLRKREDRFGGTTSTAKEEEEVGVAALHVCDFLAFGVSLFLFL